MKGGHPAAIHGRQGGMALVLVLWLVVLLSIMAAGHSRNVRTDTTLAARQVQSAKARALAEAGINHAILQLLAADTDRELRADGSLFKTRIGDDEVTVAIRDASGLVDLNAANADLLDAALKACQVEETMRLDLVDAILDWRDGDDLAHLHGVEDDGYVAAGVAWTSRDAAFESIDELKYLPGMSQALYDRLAPLVTVHSGRPGLNLDYAPQVLAAALKGADYRPSGNETAPARAASDGTFHIYAGVSGNAAATGAIEAVVRISRSSKTPFTVLDWREPPRAEFPPREGAPG